ncbi:hypothetical protein BDR04DRAFT_1108004 [Suillus decipiens]|nr:hypothetical protein BDR04DRAFT_1108004 [Suillus decipiens]
MYKDFLSNKIVRFSASENPLYTKLYSSTTNLPMPSAQSQLRGHQSHQRQLLLRRRVKILLSTHFRTL